MEDYKQIRMPLLISNLHYKCTRSTWNPIERQVSTVFFCWLFCLGLTETQEQLCSALTALGLYGALQRPERRREEGDLTAQQPACHFWKPDTCLYETEEASVVCGFYFSWSAVFSCTWPGSSPTTQLCNGHTGCGSCLHMRSPSGFKARQLLVLQRLLG